MHYFTQSDLVTKPVKAIVTFNAGSEQIITRRLKDACNKIGITRIARRKNSYTITARGTMLKYVDQILCDIYGEWDVQVKR